MSNVIKVWKVAAYHPEGSISGMCQVVANDAVSAMRKAVKCQDVVETYQPTTGRFGGWSKGSGRGMVLRVSQVKVLRIVR